MSVTIPQIVMLVLNSIVIAFVVAVQLTPSPGESGLWQIAIVFLFGILALITSVLGIIFSLVRIFKNIDEKKKIKMYIVTFVFIAFLITEIFIMMQYY